MKSPIQGLYPWIAGSLLLHVCILTIFWNQSVPVLPAGAKENVMQVQISSEVETPAADIATDHQIALAQIEEDHLLDESTSSQVNEKLSAVPQLTNVYVSGRELEQRPYPAEPVVVPYPEAAQGKPTGSVTLALYVGVDGAVERVEVAQSDLSVEFERAAVETFQMVKMHPGIKDGQATKAKIKILVEFESQ
jgi:TonB family protein